LNNKAHKDFTTLSEHNFKIDSNINFDDVVELMNNRFFGLPFFHQSIHLEVEKVEKLKQQSGLKIVVPERVYKSIDPHLQIDFEDMLSYIEQRPGDKTFNLIYLQIKLNSKMVKKEIQDYGTTFKIFLSLLQKQLSSTKVPVVLASMSIKNGSSYESLAVGINGVNHYSSILKVRQICNHSYIIEGGLNAQVFLKDINHFYSKYLHYFNGIILPKDLFNNYLKNHLYAEKEDIMERLCKYVFNGCKTIEDSNNYIKIEKQQTCNAFKSMCFQPIVSNTNIHI
jgi:hypothetical protein